MRLIFLKKGWKNLNQTKVVKGWIKAQDGPEMVEVFTPLILHEEEWILMTGEIFNTKEEAEKYIEENQEWKLENVTYVAKRITT